MPAVQACVGCGQVGTGKVSPQRRIGMQIQHRQGRLPQRVTHGVRQGTVGQQRDGRCIAQHEGQALGGLARVQRHIAATSLEHRQHCHHHLLAARQAQRHAVVGLHTQAAQVMRQPVGLRVEGGVAYFAALMCKCDGIGPERGMRLEEFVHAARTRVRRVRGIPVEQHLAPFVGRQHIQLAQRSCWGLLQGRQQLLQCLLHIATHALRISRRLSQHGQPHNFAQIVNVQAQWIVGAALRYVGRGATARGGWRATPLAVVEQGTEQRNWCGHGAAALGQHQRRVLMVQQLRQQTMHRAQPVTHAQFTQAHAHRQCVHEQSQHLVSGLATLQARRQHGAKHHVVAVAATGQHQSPCQMA